MRVYNNKPNSTSFKKGHKKLGGFIKGSKHKQESIKKVSQSLYGKRGKLARRWKGNLAGYVAIHSWIKQNFGKADKCENLDCRKSSNKFEWASISGENRREVSDYLQLCASCHRRYDNGNLIIKTSCHNYERKYSIWAKCPHCDYDFEVKL